MIDLCPRVPKQDNSSDCGVYLLQYVESFFQVQMQSTFSFPPNYLKPQKPIFEQNSQTQKSCQVSKVSKPFEKEEMKPILK